MHDFYMYTDLFNNSYRSYSYSYYIIVYKLQLINDHKYVIIMH